MEVKILEKKNNQLCFVVLGVDLAIANTLRRLMISEVPSMAIEDVIIIENSSSMEDEILAHRLGLIPLTTDLDSYILREKCDCHNELGCGKCNAILTLEADAENSMRTVYSKDLKSSDPDIMPVSNEIPILKLARNQKIRLEAYARLGRGSEHAKWQPVSVCTVRPLSKITIDQQKCDACEICVKECYKQVFRVNGGLIEIVDYELCDGCMECVESCPKDAIEVESGGHNHVFYIETTGVMPPERIFESAIDILKEKSSQFVDHLLNLK